MRSLTAILIIPVLVTACSMQEIADTNKKISDGASGIMNSLRGNSNPSTDVTTPMHLPQSLKKESKSKNYTVAVDVDTAAARIKDITSLCQVRSWIVYGIALMTGHGKRPLKMMHIQFGRQYLVAIIKWDLTGMITII